MKTYAVRIKELRLDNHMTQIELAQKIGYSNTAVSDWENGLKQPGADAIIALAQLFDESADYILGLKEE